MSTQNISTVTKEKQQDGELKLTLNTKYFAVWKSERRLYLIIHPSLFFCVSSSGSDSGAGTYLSCYRERLEAGYSLDGSPVCYRQPITFTIMGNLHCFKKRKELALSQLNFWDIDVVS